MSTMLAGLQRLGARLAGCSAPGDVAEVAASELPALPGVSAAELTDGAQAWPTPGQPPSTDDAATVERRELRDADDRVLGVLVVRCARPAETETTGAIDVAAHLVQSALRALAPTLERTAVSPRDRELQALTGAMTETLDFGQIFERVSRVVRLRLRAHTVSVFETDGHRIRLLRTDLATTGDGRQLSLPLDDLPLDEHARNLLDRVTAAGAILAVAHWPALRPLELRPSDAVLAAAHRLEDGARVLLLAGVDAPERLGAADIAYLEELARLTALALRNARLYEDARESAERDPLTGLKNRRAFWTELAAELTGSHPHTALALLDLDDFKAINDNHGHAVGDAVLEHVTHRLVRVVRHTDLLYRLGGDEFAVVMPGAHHTAARDVIARATAAMASARIALPTPSLSAGVAAAPEAGTTAEALYAAADAALYEAKERKGEGGDRVVPAIER